MKDKNSSLYNDVAMSRCLSCRFWRDKGWNGDEGIGICDNPLVIKQVSMMSESIIEKFVLGNTDKDKKSNARFLANSLRFNSNFGCIHYKEKQNVQKKKSKNC